MANDPRCDRTIRLVQLPEGVLVRHRARGTGQAARGRIRPDGTGERISGRVWYSRLFFVVGWGGVRAKVESRAQAQRAR